MEEEKRQEEELAEKTDTSKESKGESRQESQGQPASSCKSNDSDELMQKKVICSLAYIFGILFFLPLVLYPNDEFAKFHANQALVVLLTVIIGEAVFGILSLIPVLNLVFGILCGVLGLIMLIACVFAILGVVREEKTELPLIGKFKILK